MIVEIFRDEDSSIEKRRIEQVSLKDLQEIVGGKIRIYKKNSFSIITKKNKSPIKPSNRTIRKKYLKEVTSMNLLESLSETVVVVKDYF